MKIKLSILVIIVILCESTLKLTMLEAQDLQLPPNTTLIYHHWNSETSEFIILTSESRQVYTLPQGKCSSISPTGIYAISTSMDGDDLIIRHMDTQEVFVQTPWQATWANCDMFWLNDTQLSIRDKNEPSQRLYYDIASGVLTPFTFQPPSPPQYPAFPDWMPSTRDNYVLPSPDPNIFLYERCNGQITTSSGETCATETDFVIYDSSASSILEVLSNPNGILIKGVDSNDRPFSYGSAVWSSDGRYLAYQTLPQATFDRFNLAIYDLVTDQYLDTEWLNAQIDAYKAMQWSHQGNKLIFWIEGRVGEVQPDDDDRTLRSLVIFDAATGEFKVADQPFDLRAGSIERVGLWSPNGQGFVFVDMDENLIYVDTHTGVSSILETNSNHIIAWTE